jgi:glycosyltransferase involved in cell wall biosynthesis
MSDLLVVPFTPRRGSGQAMRTYGVARALAALGPLDLLYVVHGDPEPAPDYLEMEGLTLHAVTPSRGARRGLAYAAARARGVPHDFARGSSPELTSAAERLAAAPGRGRVVADGPVVAATLADLAGRRPVIYNAHNLESAFRHDVGEGTVGSRRALARFERGLLTRAHESWMVSRLDMETATALAPKARLRHVPNVVDVAAIEPVQSPPGERRALFVADYRWPPNAEGARYLVEEIFPRVWDVLPDARLALAGRDLPDGLAGDPRIEALGFVDDLRAAYASADCVVVPLLSGGGSPLKFVEALAYGLPVVATPKAAAGLDVTADEHYRAADDAAGFARATAEVLAHGAPELAAQGRAVAEERYSIEALARRIAA